MKNKIIPILSTFIVIIALLFTTSASDIDTTNASWQDSAGSETNAESASAIFQIASVYSVYFKGFYDAIF